ncbi:MAG: hypothetical protein ACLQG3_09430 [Terracidiphilus sp.]
MASHVRWGRFFRIAGIAVLALIVCLAAVVPIQQRILRWRAERLLNDIRQIQMGKSTWADAQRLMNRWGNWGKWEGPCDARSCDYQIVLQDTSHTYPTYFLTAKDIEVRTVGHEYRDWQRRLYSLLGGRSAQVYADIKVKNEIIWVKGISVDIEMLPLRHDPEISDPDFLVAQANGVTSMRPGHLEMPVSEPEYAVEKASICTGCRLIDAEFTPHANARIVDRLFDINLSCITRWAECETVEEVAPSMAEAARDLHSGGTKLAPAGDIDVFPLETLARDYHYAAVAEAIGPALLRTHVAGRDQQPSFRILQGLKNHALDGSGLVRGWQIPRIESPKPADGKPHVVPPGSKVILLFDLPLDDPDVIDLCIDGCVVVPATLANLAAVRRGIALDAMSDIP